MARIQHFSYRIRILETIQCGSGSKPNNYGSDRLQNTATGPTKMSLPMLPLTLCRHHRLGECHTHQGLGITLSPRENFLLILHGKSSISCSWFMSRSWSRSTPRYVNFLKVLFFFISTAFASSAMMSSEIIVTSS